MQRILRGKRQAEGNGPNLTVAQVEQTLYPLWYHTRRLAHAVAFTWVLLGLSILVGPRAWYKSPSYSVIFSVLPPWAWGTLHICTGAAILLCRLRHRGLIGYRSLYFGTAFSIFWGAGFAAAATEGSLITGAAPIMFGFFAYIHWFLISFPILRTVAGQDQRHPVASDSEP